MTSSGQGTVVPVWTIGTEVSKVTEHDAAVLQTDGITPERLSQLRDALASIMDSPLVSLEAYQLPVETKIPGGRLLDATSPLAQNLTSLIQHSSTSLKVAAPKLSTSGETLYRMVVPAKVASQMGSGLARSMPSAAANGGIYSGVLGAAGLVGHATFVPVAAEAATGAGAAAAAGTAAGGVAVASGVGLVTVAAPFVLLAVATAATVYAEEQRRRALERITELLSDLKQAQLDDERDALMASSRAIEKATAVLLDEGTIGHSLGLDSAVHNIDKAVEAAARRADDWQRKFDGFSESGVTVSKLTKAYPGIERPGGEFRAQLRMAAFAIAMKRRVAVLQAVEHAQQAPEQTLPRFASVLKSEQETVDDLERQLTRFLTALARVQLRPSDRTIDKLVTRGEVRDLLAWSPRLRELAETETAATGSSGDLEIAMIRQTDGRVRVLAMAPAA